MHAAQRGTWTRRGTAPDGSLAGGGQVHRPRILHRCAGRMRRGAQRSGVSARGHGRGCLPETGPRCGDHTRVRGHPTGSARDDPFSAGVRDEATGPPGVPSAVVFGVGDPGPPGVPPRVLFGFGDPVQQWAPRESRPSITYGGADEVVDLLDTAADRLEG